MLRNAEPHESCLLYEFNSVKWATQGNRVFLLDDADYFFIGQKIKWRNIPIGP